MNAQSIKVDLLFKLCSCIMDSRVMTEYELVSHSWSQTAVAENTYSFVKNISLITASLLYYGKNEMQQSF